jgi:hypothetical protein
MRTGSKSPLLPAIIREQTNEKLQTGKKVKPKHVEPSKPARLKIWREDADAGVDPIARGVIVVIENTASRVQTRLPMTYEQYGEFVSGYAAVVTPFKSTS